jgi:hypothetical protein
VLTAQTHLKQASFGRKPEICRADDFRKKAFLHLNATYSIAKESSWKF